MADVVVLGSLNVDLVLRVPRLPTPGQTVLGGQLQRHCGGKGANQAVAAARLAEPHRSPLRVRMVGRVGTDDAGAFLLTDLASAGVDASGVRADHRAATGSALILVDDTGENMIAVAAGANALVDEDDAARAVAGLGPGDLLVCQLEVPVAAVTLATTMAHSQGVRVILNAAPAATLTARFLANVDLLVVNETEARTVLPAFDAGPEGLTPEAAVAMAADAGCAVVVTLGAAGAVFAALSGAAGRLLSHPVSVVDTVGAGDAFVGGLAVALHGGAGLAAAVAFAVAAGALAVTAPGAREALPDAAAVRQLMSR